MSDESGFYRSRPGVERTGHRSSGVGGTPSEQDAVRALRRAVDRLLAACATSTGTGHALVTAAEFERQRLRLEAETIEQREMAIARNRGSQQVIEHSLRARDAALRLAPGPLGAEWDSEHWRTVDPTALAVAEWVRSGDLLIRSGDTATVNTDVRVPLIVPLLNRSNVVIASAPEDQRVEAVLRAIVLRALAGTGPTQLRLIAFDPTLGATLAPFLPLRSVSEDLLPTLGSSEGDLEDLLEQLARDVQRVRAMFRGRDTSLGEYIAGIGLPVESYQLVVLRDFPMNLSSSAAGMLGTLLDSGPRCGITFVIHMNIGMEMPDVSTLTTALSNTPTLDLTLDPPKLRSMPDFEWDPGEAVDLDHLDRVVGMISAQAAAAVAPEVAFVDLHRSTMWSESSAERITATVGRSGVEPVMLTLGDRRDQRHNILVSGAVGQGKSNLLMTLIHSLAVKYGPEELRMYLIDLKEGLTLFPLAPSDLDPSFLPHARVIGLESDREFAVAVLEELVGEFERRSALFKPYGDDIGRYRSAQPEVVMPRLLVVIDEFHVLFEGTDRLSEIAVADLERLARKGRAYGIHLVLASQTLTGITALLSKQDGIFAQFPIRVALKNSQSESRVVLDQDNPDAARLRFRGEAIVNEDFGSRHANRKAIIAAADAVALRELRQVMWRRLPEATSPSVFSGSARVTLLDDIERLSEYRTMTRSGRMPVVALLGRAISVDQHPVGVGLTSDGDRHLAVVGSSHRSNPLAPGQPALDQGWGVIQAAALSLAVQSGADAEFVLLDLISGESEDPGVKVLFEGLAGVGSRVTWLTKEEVAEYLNEAELLLRNRPASYRTYVVGLGLDRGNLRRSSESFQTPVDGLHLIIKQGPGSGVHLLAWWSNVRSLSDHMGFERWPGSLLALKVQRREIPELMGPLVEWEPRDNRGFLLDRLLAPDPFAIIPYAPLVESEAAAEFVNRDWDG